jgi:hypothetical protein
VNWYNNKLFPLIGQLFYNLLIKYHSATLRGEEKNILNEEILDEKFRNIGEDTGIRMQES